VVVAYSVDMEEGGQNVKTVLGVIFVVPRQSLHCDLLLPCPQNEPLPVVITSTRKHSLHRDLFFLWKTEVFL
jgi:hypothetical protein